MKHSYFLLLVLSLVINSCNSSYNEHSVPFTEKKIEVDGSMLDEGWQIANWRAIDQRWLGSEYSDDDFKGRFKMVWDHDHLYVLAEITDNILMDKNKDGLVKYWDDDCLEVFIDEDASGGNHQYNYNAFAYHIALDGKVVDIGVDSLPDYYNHIKSVRKTEGNNSIWELSIDIYDDGFQYDGKNKKVFLKDSKAIGFAIAYCDNDKSEERENFIGSVKVEGKDKNRGWIDAGIFEEFVLVKTK
ncbi:MAG: sugar-binding protein [Saprospiraceae bacterium]